MKELEKHQEEFLARQKEVESLKKVNNHGFICHLGNDLTFFVLPSE